MTRPLDCDGNSWEDDSSYLFRMCSNYGWNEAMAICDALIEGMAAAATATPTPAPTTPARGPFVDNVGMRWRAWESRGARPSLGAWLRLAHAQLAFRDEYGNRPLHAACYNKPPPAVVERLFRLARVIWEHRPHYAQSSPAFAEPCGDGSTPLLVAASTGVSNAVIHLFLDEIDLYIERGWADPQAARMLVLQPDQQGYFPLQGFFSFHHDFLKRRLAEQTTAGRGAASPPPSYSYREQYSSMQTLANHWSVALRMLRFCTRHIRPHAPPSTPVLVHRCAAIAPRCPPLLLDWAVTPSVEGVAWRAADASAATADGRGTLPLHRALEARDGGAAREEGAAQRRVEVDGPRNAEEGETPFAIAAGGTVQPRNEVLLYRSPTAERRRVGIVAKLLRWHPKAASIPLPSGRSPFAQAIVYGATWNPMRSTEKRAQWRVPAEQETDGGGGLLHLLWTHLPAALSEVDRATGLFPFMLAATLSDRANDADAVDTIYNLLRHAPQLVESGHGQ